MYVYTGFSLRAGAAMGAENWLNLNTHMAFLEGRYGKLGFKTGS